MRSSLCLVAGFIMITPLGTVSAQTLATPTFLTPPVPDSLPVGPVLPAYVPSVPLIGAAADTGHHRQRPRPIEYSDSYYTRLKIHMIASYATVPLFVAEYFVGRSLYNNPDSASRSLRGWHNNLAAAIGGLFAVNTVTGVWNLWDSRHDPAGRARRYIHGISMLAADAGFVAAAMMAPSREFRRSGGTVDQSSASLHRGIAITSMGLSLGSYLMMLIWKN